MFEWSHQKMERDSVLFWSGGYKIVQVTRKPFGCLYNLHYGKVNFVIFFYSLLFICWLYLIFPPLKRRFAASCSRLITIFYIYWLKCSLTLLWCKNILLVDFILHMHYLNTCKVSFLSYIWDFQSVHKIVLLKSIIDHCFMQFRHEAVLMADTEKL